jgi:hypothetical protein
MFITLSSSGRENVEAEFREPKGDLMSGKDVLDS